MKNTFFFTFLIFISACTFSNIEDELNELSPTLDWSKKLHDNFYRTSINQTLAPTSDNGFLVTKSQYLIRYDERGNLLDSISTGYGLMSVKQLNTNGYLATAQLNDSLILIRFDEDFNEEWIRFDSLGIYGTQIVELNNEFIVYNFNTLLKYDSNGNLLWIKELEEPIINSIIATTDNHLVLTGNSSLTDSKAWIAKMNADGAIIWQKTYGSRKSDKSLGVHETINGNYIMLINAGQKSSDFSKVNTHYHTNVIVVIDKNDGSLIQVTGVNSESEPDLLLSDGNGEFIIIGKRNEEERGIRIFTQESNNLIKIDENGIRKWELSISLRSSRISTIGAIYTLNGGLLLFTSEGGGEIQYKFNPEK